MGCNTTWIAPRFSAGYNQHQVSQHIMFAEFYLEQMTLLCLPHSELLPPPPPSPIQCCLYVVRGLWHHDTSLFWGERVNRLTQQGQLKQNMAVARTFHTLTRIHHRCESFWPHSQMLIQNANGVWVPICWASHSLRVWMLILSDWDRSPCPFRPSSSIHVYFYEMKFNLVTDHKLDVIYGPCSKSCMWK